MHNHVHHSEPFSYKKLAVATGMVAILSTIVNLALTVLGKTLSQPPATFGPYMTSTVIALNVMGVVAAGVGYAIARWWYPEAWKANRNYLIIATLLLIASFYPDVAMPWSTDPDQAGWTLGIIVNLMLMHVVTFALVIYYFTRRTNHSED